MRRALTALLLALVACLGLVVAAPHAVADDDDGLVGGGVEIACDVASGGGLDVLIPGDTDVCDAIGDAHQKALDKAWKAVWDSVIGDVIRAGKDVAKWILKLVFTLGLRGPSLKLEDTGLFGPGVTMAGMLVWLGWMVTVVAFMWQIGRMAVTGQMRHLGTAVSGYAQNALITLFGATLISMLLVIGDVMTTGMVDVAFGDDDPYKRVLAVMLPYIANPVTMAGVLLLLLVIGIIQIVLIFLRQSAIPLQALLLPIAGAGRMGGKATQAWAPKLITSILMVIAYKPMLAIIICIGFTEFGESKTVVEFLRGLATFVLAILAPGPLMKVFAPIGEAVGGGLASGGGMGALQAVGQLADLSSRAKGGGSGDAPDDRAVVNDTAMNQARYMQLQQNGPGPDNPDPDPDPSQHASRKPPEPDNGGGNKPNVPPQGGGNGSAPPGGAPNGAPAGGGTTAGVGVALEVLDGIDRGVHNASGKIGGDKT